jgi:hypothetical protein
MIQNTNLNKLLNEQTKKINFSFSSNNINTEQFEKTINKKK